MIQLSSIELLRAITQYGDLSIVAKEFGVSKAQIQNRLIILESQGYLSRVADDSDCSDCSNCAESKSCLRVDDPQGWLVTQKGHKLISART